MATDPNEIVPTSRKVIQQKLLTALTSGEDLAACLFSEQDLLCLIDALERVLKSKDVGSKSVSFRKRQLELSKSLQQLRKAAFGG